eukprot:COSAG01_NODE_131_length_24907_cov_19.802201_17_plen_284_part_00
MLLAASKTGGDTDRAPPPLDTAAGRGTAQRPQGAQGQEWMTADAQRLSAETASSQVARNDHNWAAPPAKERRVEYQMDSDDLDYKLDKLRQGMERLETMDKEHIKAHINALDDIESGVWAAPFFGAFAAMRLLLLILCGQTVALVSVVFVEGGLAFPAWICFSLAIATIVTGFPSWWEPMTNNHAKLHIITSALASTVTTLITVLLAEKFEIADSRQRGKVVGLYAGLAVLEFLGCFFAVRVAQQTKNVDLYVKARLIEWRHDVERGKPEICAGGSEKCNCGS